MNNSNLFLILKKQWFDLIASGLKLEEYREIKPYWIKRFCDTNIHLPYVYCKMENCCLECFKDNPHKFAIRQYKTATFQLGYKHNASRMTFEIENISVGHGNPLWGAQDNTDYFVIRLGKRIK